LTRFSSDQDQVDTSLASHLQEFIEITLSLLFVTATVIFATYWFALLMIPIVLLFALIQSYYMPASRDNSRIGSITRAPIANHVTETMDGIFVVRSWEKTKYFEKSYFSKLDDEQKAFYNLISTNRWLFVQFQFLSAFIIGSISVFAIITPISNATFAGVALLNSTKIVGLLTSFLRIYGFLENAMVNLERIMQYLKLAPEAASHTDYPLDKDWPKNGKIEFEDYSTTYKEDLEPVLKEINLTVQPGEKVGIVGRTGAGKSSLTLALFRILESLKGKLVIDDVDISQIGLLDLRTRLTILPQDSIVFNGTIRENLDPNGTCTDDELWQVLESVQLSDFVKNQELKLEAPLTDKSTFSAGQGQLFCLARAMLRKTRIFILDEATANVDLDTDKVVQALIRKEFANCTVLTIAHRIATVMDYDKIVVLDFGKVVEFDSPSALLQNPNSIFYSLASSSGLIQ
jgi:ABC-type multidrug transport system fused ATPase/permease subunit